MYEREKPFCTNVASHSAPNQFTISSIYKNWSLVHLVDGWSQRERCVLVHCVQDLGFYLVVVNMNISAISYYIDISWSWYYINISISDCPTCDIESQSRTRTTTSSSSSSYSKESLFWSNIVSDNPNEDNNNKREPSSSSCLKESRIWSNYDDAEHNEDNENKREPATWTTQQAIVEAATASL